MRQKRFFSFTVSGHVHIYVYWEKEMERCLSRVYVDSRRPGDGFSLGFVLSAIEYME